MSFTSSITATRIWCTRCLPTARSSRVTISTHFRARCPDRAAARFVSRALAHRLIEGLQAAARIVCVSQAGRDELVVARHRSCVPRDRDSERRAPDVHAPTGSSRRSRGGGTARPGRVLSRSSSCTSAVPFSASASTCCSTSVAILRRRWPGAATDSRGRYCSRRRRSGTRSGSGSRVRSRCCRSSIDGCWLRCIVGRRSCFSRPSAKVSACLSPKRWPARRRSSPAEFLR